MSSILILDFGSQYTQLIARRIREIGVYCEIHPYNADPSLIEKLDAAGVILSGGPASVYDDKAPKPHADFLQTDLPVLGICYGMGVLAVAEGGRVAGATHREYGPAEITIRDSSGIFGRFAVGDTTPVWMSHGDRLEQPPEGWDVLADTPNSPTAAMRRRDGKRYAVQFHPEVVHTADGRSMLESFVVDVCGVAADWTMEGFVESAVQRIREQVGDGEVICGISGGVDSTVTAALIDKAVPGQLTCVFVDNGLLRKNEADEVREFLTPHFGDSLICVDATDRFLDALAGVSDPEKKRKIIGNTFIDVFDESAKRAREGKPQAGFLGQGTLYPDVIESVSVKGPSATIKSHHNVGGLPERMRMELVEPLRELFKDEVRKLGEVLGLPRELLWRHPFPGPGLAVRLLGEIVRGDLDTLREADAIFIEEIRRAGLYDEIWQAFAVLLPVHTVGVQGDKRTYDRVIALRAITSSDGMTADWYRFPHDVLAAASSRISNEVAGVNRVAYDISSKPPATVEWE